MKEPTGSNDTPPKIGTEITESSSLQSSISLTLLSKPETKPETKLEEVKTFKYAGEIIKVTATEAASVGAKEKKTTPNSSSSNNIGSLLESLKGKRQMTTTQKSALDWAKYKKTENLEHDLEKHKKDGYLEKQAFLSRTDYRQFEVERDARNKTRQINYKKSLGT